MLHVANWVLHDTILPLHDAILACQQLGSKCPVILRPVTSNVLPVSPHCEQLRAHCKHALRCKIFGGQCSFPQLFQLFQTDLGNDLWL